MSLNSRPIGRLATKQHSALKDLRGANFAVRYHLHQAKSAQEALKMSGILENRVAIVTGGARGIGLALAQIMVMQGAKVVIADNGCSADGSPEDPVVANAAVDRCNQIAPNCAVAWNENIAIKGAAQQLVEFTRKSFGAVDIVVNNAAVQRPDDLLKPDIDLFEFVVSNNLTAAYALLAAAAPLMREQISIGRLPGSIVNVISASAVYGTYGHAAYSAAKAGLWGLTRASALDLKSIGITCNAVMPFAGTRGLKNSDETHPAASEYKAANGKIAASHAANLMAWLASPQAAAITGQLLGVRGREVLLFNQQRPIRTVFTSAGVLDADALSHSIMDQFGPEFTDLLSDFETWSSDPVI
jgi:NAD(P)-dependent dehydrogenase (short-subunit alcohol dehydrogenase family)